MPIAKVGEADAPDAAVGKELATMISLKKYMDLDADELNKHLKPRPDDLVALVLDAYRSALVAMGNSGGQACPTLGPELQQGLMTLAERLSEKTTAPVVRETEEQVGERLQQWGGRAAEYFQQRADEVKEILMVLARTAESAAERDQHHSSQFGEFTTRLQAMVKLEDLPQIRTALLRGAEDLKTCVTKMEQDSRKSVAALRAQVSTYQTKLEEAEHRAAVDALTGLYNRHGVEKRMEDRIAGTRPFCLVMLDLNGFKQVNDTYGHLAGDDLLKQFAGELRSAARSTDVVGRWGGDEFIVLVDASLAEAKSHVERIHQWVFGKYKVRRGTEALNVNIDAAIGLVAWQPGESMKAILGRVDAAMYQQKAAARTLAANPGGRAKELAGRSPTPA
ncbi:MAG TPA: GGDEF domain-containing protein [Terriglobia bacterium]|nr:GGDEF domain-containing protein [Terriglobia bacterium]